MNLSEYFTLEELVFSIHRNINNIPPIHIISALKDTAMALEGVRTLLNAPIIINSGYRSPALNKAVGGVIGSQHTKGQAVDFTARSFGTPDQIVAAIKKSNIQFDQLIREYNSWVHISFSTTPRKQILIIDKEGTRPYGT